VSGLDLTLKPERSVRRVEIINGIGGRRRWSADDKARMVEETLAPGAVVSEVARRHGLTPQQLFTWRRAARRPLQEAATAPLFIPAVVAAPAADAAAETPSPASRPVRRRRRREVSTVASTIELEIDGVRMRVGPGADAATITAVIRALKAGA
jgi:transposase